MKTYQANRKGLINYVLIGAILLPIGVVILDPDTFTEKPFILLPLLIPAILVFWIYFDTSHKIDKDQLIYRSGFLKGEIESKTIQEIKKGKTMWSGIKPALAKKGLIILYRNFDEKYIAPENNSEMISDLLKLNSKIKITE